MTPPDAIRVVDARAREARSDHPLRETAAQVGVGDQDVRERHVGTPSIPAVGVANDYGRSMAIVARILVEAVGSDDHDRLERAVEKKFATLGGPPDGLMVHLGYPDGDSLMVIEAWRTEALFQSYMEEVFLPALTEAGLTANEPEIGPAWSIGRP
jgi:hypothetical protein